MAISLLIVQIAIVMNVVCILVVISILIIEVDVECWLLHRRHLLFFNRDLSIVSSLTKKAVNNQGSQYSS